MPRPPKRAAARRNCNPQEIKLLMTGVSLTTRFGAVHKGQADMAGLRQLWDELRDELIDQWIDENPFSRPWGWLQFDATEPRLRTVGEQRIESMEAVKNRGRFGGSYRLCYFANLNVRLGAEETRGNEGEWETERQYLARIGALTPEELALL